MSNYYTIKKETLSNTADAIRQFLVPGALHIDETLCSPVLGEQKIMGALIHANSRIKYLEYIDEAAEFDRSDDVDYPLDNEDIWAWGYAKNNQGVFVPVLIAQFGDLFFYEGLAEPQTGAGFYDKWRKIDNVGNNAGTSFCTWDSITKKWIYTDPMVVEQVIEETTYSPVNFPEKISEVYTAGLTATGIQNANEEVY